MTRIFYNFIVVHSESLDARLCPLVGLLHGLTLSHTPLKILDFVLRFDIVDYELFLINVL